MKIDIISDVHLGAHCSEERAFIEYLKQIKTDWLILNGDVYDLYVSKPKINIFEIINENKDIKKWTYIIGNHDKDIKKYFTDLVTLENVEIDDIIIFHGHQFDSSLKPCTKCITKLRDWLERKLKFNFRKWMLKYLPCILIKMMNKIQNRAVKFLPTKRVIIGHTHIALDEYPIFNTGSFCDRQCTSLTILREPAGSMIKLNIHKS